MSREMKRKLDELKRKSILELRRHSFWDYKVWV